MPRQHDQSLLHAALRDLHAVLQLVHLHAVPEEQAQLLAVGGVELQLHEGLVAVLEVDEVLRPAQDCPFLDVDDEHLEGGRAAGDCEVLAVEGQLDCQDLERADVADLEVARGVGVVEVEVGGLAVVGEDGDSALVESSEGLVGASLGVAEWAE